MAGHQLMLHPLPCSRGGRGAAGVWRQRLGRRQPRAAAAPLRCRGWPPGLCLGAGQCHALRRRRQWQFREANNPGGAGEPPGCCLFNRDTIHRSRGPFSCCCCCCEHPAHRVLVGEHPGFLLLASPHACRCARCSAVAAGPSGAWPHTASPPGAALLRPVTPGALPQDASGQTPVGLAAEAGHPECVAVLLEQPPGPGEASAAGSEAGGGAAAEGKRRGALHLAAARGLLDIAQKMLGRRRWVA